MDEPDTHPICRCGDGFTSEAVCVNCTLIDSVARDNQLQSAVEEVRQLVAVVIDERDKKIAAMSGELAAMTAQYAKIRDFVMNVANGQIHFGAVADLTEMMRQWWEKPKPS